MTGPGYEAFTEAQAIITDSAEDTSEWPDPEGEHGEGFLNVDAALSGS